MIANASGQQSQFEKYVSLLRRLHELIARGEGDSDNADAIRDEMDGPWYELSDVEMARARGLSGDLNSLTGSEVYAAEDRSKPVSETELKNAWELEHYDGVLMLLHRPAPFLKPDEIAFMRAHCWGQLGDLQTALLFYRRAAELVPQDEQYAVMLMLTLLGLGRLSEAGVCAAHLANDVPVTIPVILLRAAGVLFAGLDDLHSSTAASANQHIIDLITRAFILDRNTPAQSKLRDSDVSRYLVVLAMCYDGMGKQREATDARERAVEIDPRNKHGQSVQAPQQRALQANGNILADREALRHEIVNEGPPRIRLHNFHPTGI
jgi:tetratricopeptide (TPR) repeat protein